MKEQRDNKKNAARRVLTSEEAGEWFLRLQAGELSGADRREYLRWLKQFPEHVEEMLALKRLHALLTRLQLAAPRGLGSTAGASSGKTVPPVARPGNERIVFLGMQRLRVAALALSFIIVAGIVLAVALTAPGNLIETAPGEWLTHTLDDGTQLRVGPRTRLRVRLVEERRTVSLEEGEAVFDVAKDPARPFVVVNEHATARAVGTRFGVARLGKRTVVTVEEGKVEVTRNRPFNLFHPLSTLEASPAVVLLANQQVSVSASGPEAVRQVDARRELAWAARELIVENEPLPNVVALLNRRNELQIELQGQQLTAVHISGRFAADDPEAFVKLLASLSPLRVERVSRDLVRLIEVEPEAAPLEE